MIEESQAWLRDFFSDLVELTAEEKQGRTAAIRGIAERSRTDSAAQSYVKWLVQQIEPDLPMEAQVSRVYYLDGQTARQVGRALCMDKRSIYRCICWGLDAMRPLVFGLDGIFKNRPVVE